MGQSIRPDVYASVLITLIPAILCFGLRFYARRVKKVPLWYDDWLAVVGLFVAKPCTLLDELLTLSQVLYYGMGLHLPDLSISYEKALYYSSINDIIQEMTYTLGIGATQLSLLALYWRLFRTVTSARTSIFLIAAFTIVWLIVRIFITLFQCQPLAYYWDRTIDGKCNIDPSKFYIGSVASHLVIDIVLMVLPAVQINHLKIPLAQRVAITVMFMFGILICVAAIMMIVVSTRYNSYAEDVMWNGAAPTYWSAVEIHLSLIACCLPVLRPVMRKALGFFGHSLGSSSGQTNPSIKLSTVPRSQHNPRSQHYIKTGESTSNLAEPGKYHSGSSIDYDHPNGEETVTNIRATSVGETSSKGSNEGILVKYEVNLDFSGKRR
ncbi:hypothetical protein G7046_g3921 [Stylonectria norvegica]|nr:hypothetical protein G7046_g3921 [Stylonectria norvegica]